MKFRVDSWQTVKTDTQPIGIVLDVIADDETMRFTLTLSWAEMLALRDQLQSDFAEARARSFLPNELECFVFGSPTPPGGQP